MPIRTGRTTGHHTGRNRADNPPGGVTASPAELLDGVRKGDTACWKELIRRYERLVRARIATFRLQEADRNDAEQATWLRLAEQAARIRDAECLPGWLGVVATHEAMAIARRAVAAHPIDPQTQPQAADEAAPQPEQRVIDADTAAILWRAIDRLLAAQRMLMRGLYSDNPVSYADFARVTGRPIGSIGPTRMRALRTLRRMLDPAVLVGS